MPAKKKKKKYIKCPMCKFRTTDIFKWFNHAVREGHITAEEMLKVFNRGDFTK